VLPPKDHLSLEERYRGHFNILKGYVGSLDLAGVKVIGDYVDNYQHGLPSELALLTLYRAQHLPKSALVHWIGRRPQPTHSHRIDPTL
jgi:ornithine cyclodeaminase